MYLSNWRHTNHDQMSHGTLDQSLSKQSARCASHSLRRRWVSRPRNAQRNLVRFQPLPKGSELRENISIFWIRCQKSTERSTGSLAKVHYPLGIMMGGQRNTSIRRMHIYDRATGGRRLNRILR